MIHYIAIPGTHTTGWNRDWDSVDSPFTNFVAANCNASQLITAPLKRYMWSARLDGVDGANDTWDASGRALADYIIPPLYGKPLLAPEDTYIITHSHGGNVVAYACGKYGLKINGLITVSTPIRKDMYDMYEMAASNIKHHLHIHGGWKDFWQAFGGLFDGNFGVHRDHPFARNETAPGGHGSMLRDEKYFPLWVDNGWLKYWAGPSGEFEPIIGLPVVGPAVPAKE